MLKIIYFIKHNIYYPQFRYIKKYSLYLIMEEVIENISQIVKKSLNNNTVIVNLTNILENLNESQILKIKQKYIKPTKGYSRNVLKKNKHFELVLICWAPHSSSPIHNHESSYCFYRILTSSIDEIRYKKITNNKLIPYSNIKHRKNSIFYIDDNDGVHKMINNANDHGFSIHIYSPPISIIKTY